MVDYLLNPESESLNSASSYLRLDELAFLEPKVGIAIDPETGSSKEEHLYRADQYRLADGFALAFHSPVKILEEPVLVRIGGEGKGALAKPLDLVHPVLDLGVAELIRKIDDSRAFKLYFASPAILDAGWLPGGVEIRDGVGVWSLGSLQVQIRAVALNKGPKIGGWNIDTGKPKPMHQTLDSGSVYYLTIAEGSAAEVVDRFHRQFVSDKRQEEGFGYTLVGVWSGPQEQ
jgi:CRISPR type III-B/RAMP module-associated protein Cmr3